MSLLGVVLQCHHPEWKPKAAGRVVRDASASASEMFRSVAGKITSIEEHVSLILAGCRDIFHAAVLSSCSSDGCVTGDIFLTGLSGASQGLQAAGAPAERHHDDRAS